MPQPLSPLGSQGLLAPRIGLGVMSAAFYGSGSTEADEEAQLAAIDRLVERSAPFPAFLDTAYIYAHPTGLHSESICGKAIAKHGRDKFIVATKFGAGAKPCSSKEVIDAEYAASVQRLGTTPDLYYQDVMADLKAMVAEGKIAYVGLSECTPDELRRAHAVHPVTAIQMEYSIAERGIETALVPVCAELGVAVVCYSPLARGLLAGGVTSKADLDAADRRAAHPRFAEGTVERNVAKFEPLRTLAAAKGCTPAQLALAWLLHKGANIFVIPGSKTAARVDENLGAAAVSLSAEDVATLDALDLKAEGARYPPAMLAISYEARM